MDSRHESGAEPLGGVLKFGAVLAVSLVAILLLLRHLHGPVFGPRAEDRPPAEDFARDLREMRGEEERILGSYGWVDRKARVVRIPIDRAMDLLAERGLPARRPR